MKCFKCGYENPGSAKYCSHCGSLITNTCPKCGKEFNSDDVFCNECGFQLKSVSKTSKIAVFGLGLKVLGALMIVGAVILFCLGTGLSYWDSDRFVLCEFGFVILSLCGIVCIKCELFRKRKFVGFAFCLYGFLIFLMQLIFEGDFEDSLLTYFIFIAFAVAGIMLLLAGENRLRFDFNFNGYNYKFASFIAYIIVPLDLFLSIMACTLFAGEVENGFELFLGIVKTTLLLIVIFGLMNFNKISYYSMLVMNWFNIICAIRSLINFRKMEQEIAVLNAVGANRYGLYIKEDSKAFFIFGISFIVVFNLVAFVYFRHRDTPFLTLDKTQFFKEGKSRCSSLDILADKFNGSPDCTSTNDVLPGVFSVGNGKVQFSKGNLWFNQMTGKWNFENRQTDYRKIWDIEHIDKFYWSRYAAVGKEYSDCTRTAKDRFFAADNFTVNRCSIWGTLTDYEWKILLHSRITDISGVGTSNARYARVTVNGVNGLLLFPDTFTWNQDTMGKSPDFINHADNMDFTWSKASNYTRDQFDKQEEAGIVFLPCAGYRNGSSCYGEESSSYYWTSTPDSDSSDYALYMYCGEYSVEVRSNSGRDCAKSLRLVTRVK